ncbi:hypothetical protein [Streptomyces sp. NPDC048188]|uniref:hypothetical protein n=1 Tax=Streptomyces sp. NPDC048188 TaxID=3155749 RepID=UPI00341B5A70
MSWTPVLPAYRTSDGGALLVWCEHESQWHVHGAVSDTPGAGDGDRAAHCACPRSPLRSTGYVVREVGPLTPGLKRQHRPARGRHRCPEPCIIRPVRHTVPSTGSRA